MPKFADRPVRQHGAVTSASVTPDTHTYEHGAGYTRDAKSELFLLAVANMVSEDTFYEEGDKRDKRYVDLIHEVTRTDPDWVARFVPYLRNTMQLRSASVMMACEYAAAGGPNVPAVVDSACARADEPGEVLAYWFSTYGRKSHAGINRGVGRAAARLYTERAVLRYDGTGRTWRFGDVVELTHPRPTDDRQSVLFRHLLDRRHGRAVVDANTMESGLATIYEDARLLEVPEADRRALLRAETTEGERSRIARAGWSWERLAGWLPGGMDAEAWEAVIPQMGYMALLRNLRNFDNAGISPAAVDAVTAKLTNPDEVAASRQFPLRFLSAWGAVAGMRWGAALETALDLSLANVPSLPGRTLVLVDVSGSMTHDSYIASFHGRDAGRSVVKPWMTAGVFGAALAARGEAAELYSYGDTFERIDMPAGAALLRTLDRIKSSRPFQTGTRTIETVAGLWNSRGPFSRVIVLTDEQAFDAGRGANRTVDEIPLIYTWNLAGYRAGHQRSGSDGRFTFGGLTDAGFRALPLLERGRDAGWPF